MCGRFTLRTPAASWTQQLLPLWTEEQRSQLADRFQDTPRYNIAPTQSVCCVTHGADSKSPRRDAKLCRWGLIPFWAKDLAIGNRMINARSETAHEKRSFKGPLVKRRCLIPADGYYEWEKTPSGKQPHLIERSGGGLLVMAGLWESNRNLGENDEPLLSCTVLTTSANATTRGIHDRMPVFLTEEAQSIWLDPSFDDIEGLRALMEPAPESWLTTTPVSTVVNSPRNDTPECVEPFNPKTQQDLFE